MNDSNDFSAAISIASSGMKAQAARLRHVSENIANTDTPGYRRKLVSFAERMELGRKVGGVEVDRLRLDQSDLARIYDPTSPMADETGHFDGSNVNLLVEIADAREAQRSYEANLKLFDQVRQMSTALNELLKR